MLYCTCILWPYLTLCQLLFQLDDPIHHQALDPFLVQGWCPPRGPHLVLFADVVQLKAPGMRPDPAQHLEVLEEFGSVAPLAALVGAPHTCTRIGTCLDHVRACVHSCLTTQYTEPTVAVKAGASRQAFTSRHVHVIHPRSPPGLPCLCVDPLPTQTGYRPRVSRPPPG